MIPIRFIEDTGSYAHRTRANAQWADLTASGYVGSDVEDCLEPWDRRPRTQNRHGKSNARHYVRRTQGGGHRSCGRTYHQERVYNAHFAKGIQTRGVIIGNRFNYEKKRTNRQDFF